LLLIRPSARDGASEDESIAPIVAMSDEGRKPADIERKTHERAMEKLAAQLPVAEWVEGIPGFGMLGLATIVAETGGCFLDRDYGLDSKEFRC
jgi:hypothetical protein